MCVHRGSEAIWMKCVQTSTRPCPTSSRWGLLPLFLLYQCFSCFPQNHAMKHRILGPAQSPLLWSVGVVLFASSGTGYQVHPSNGITRRNLASGSAGLFVLTSLFTAPVPVDADAREGLAKVASQLPGYGSPDVFFPPYFEGSWECLRECVSVSSPKGEESLLAIEPTFVKEAKEQVGERWRYKVDYIEYEGHIISARGANEEAKWKARYPEERLRRRISSMWQPNNPNILTVSLPSGVLREIKVTKRGFEEPKDGAFGTSEYCRVADAFDNAGLASVPKLAAVRVLTKYKRQGPTEIIGLELVQMYPTEGFSLTSEPLLVVKNRLTLTRP